MTKSMTQTGVATGAMGWTRGVSMIESMTESMSITEIMIMTGHDGAAAVLAPVAVHLHQAGPDTDTAAHDMTAGLGIAVKGVMTAVRVIQPVVPVTDRLSISHGTHTGVARETGTRTDVRTDITPKTEIEVPVRQGTAAGTGMTEEV